MENNANRYQKAPEEFIEWFYERYKHFVFKEASKYFDNLSDIEDLTQEVWVSVCCRGTQLCLYSTKQQMSYLAVVVKNKAISMFRKHHDTVSLESIYNVSCSDLDGIVEQIDRKIMIEAFRNLWVNIPGEDRELIERKYMMSESDEEIASSIGIQKNSVRMALSRARKKIAHLLRELADYI